MFSFAAHSETYWDCIKWASKWISLLLSVLFIIFLAQGTIPSLINLSKVLATTFWRSVLSSCSSGARTSPPFPQFVAKADREFYSSLGNSATAWNPETCPGSLSTSWSKYTSMVMALERELLAIRYSHTMYSPTGFSHLYLIIVVTASLSMNFGRYFIYRDFFSHLMKFISLTPMLEIVCGSTVLSLWEVSLECNLQVMWFFF